MPLLLAIDAYFHADYYAIDDYYFHYLILADAIVHSHYAIIYLLMHYFRYCH
jgi:hypothetical protein